MKYRPDVDGLRAIAVLAVLFYHAELEIFSGGYVGVDVFFVISGYLITTKMVKEIRANTFSFLKFYEQRIRRIFPALFAVVIFTLLVGYWLFDPQSYGELGKSSLATSLSLANVLFLSQAGYFDTPSTLKPMLHTWSLSIEEQFYFGFPLFLVLISRYLKSRYVLVLSLIGLASLGLGIYVIANDAAAVFFLIQYRAWELLVGGLLALLSLKPKKSLLNLLSLTGLGMIGFSIFRYSDATLFPGLAALLPVMGAALAIWSGSGGDSFVKKVLSVKPAVFIGKISYSLYLWHWVLLVFWRYYAIREMAIVDTIVWLLITFVVSTLSWKFIETGFRSMRFLERPKIFVFAGSTMVIVVALSLSVYLSDGVPKRFANSQSAMPSPLVWDAEKGKWNHCFAWDEGDYDFAEMEDCILGDHNVKSLSFIVWGDSHADALASSVNASALREHKGGYLVSASGCPPLQDINASMLPYCYEHNQEVIEFIETHPDIKNIILIARWSLYTEASRYAGEEGDASTLIDMRSGEVSNPDNVTLFGVGLERTIKKMTELDRNVIVVSSVPEIGYQVPSAFSIALRTGQDINQIIAPTYAEYLIRNQHVFPVFETQAAKENVTVLSPSDILCNEDICNVTVDGMPLYRDDDHLSTLGALYISEIFDTTLESFLSEKLE